MQILKYVIIILFNIFILCGGLLQNYTYAQNIDSLLNREISLNQQKVTIFQFLNQISDSIHFFFAYDSHVVDNDRKISYGTTGKPLKYVLREILSDSTLVFKLIENHIIVTRPEPIEKTKPLKITGSDKVTIAARVYDNETRAPIPQANVSVNNSSMGTVTNKEGYFRVSFPAPLLSKQIQVSHIGYLSKTLPLNVLYNNQVDIYLEPEQISIPEVIVRSVDAQTLIEEAIERIPENYSPTPVQLHCFYREGVLMKEKYIYYLESVFEVYKAAYPKNRETDMAKLLLSRRTDNRDHTDTLFAKLRGGMHSALTLDIVRIFPNFFEPEAPDFYDFWRNDIVLVDNRLAYEIGFKQKSEVTNPLYQGMLFIDIETLAFVGANFELHPYFIEKATHFFIPKRNPRFHIAAEKINYSVRYRQEGNRYHLSHVRGDLNFKYRRRKNVFKHTFKVFFEMVTTDLDSINVQPFQKDEAQMSRRVLFDNLTYSDTTFWQGYNTIAPEESIFKALKKIKNKSEDIQVIENK